MDESLKKMLMRHEGLRLKPYHCSAGKLTIGYGRNLEDRGITNAEAEYLLTNDINDAIVECRDSFPWWKGLTNNRKMVVVDMVFNLGLANFKKFKKTIACIEKEAYTTAAIEMLDSRWAAQVGTRADELAHMMKEG